MPNYHPVERSFFYGGDMQKHLQIISRKFAKQIGMTYYFTGKPCCNGHTSTRNTKTGACQECQNAAYRIWQCANREYELARQRGRSTAYRRNNPDLHAESMRRGRKRYLQKNRDDYNLYMRSVNSARRCAINSGDCNILIRRHIKSQEKLCLYCGIECESTYHVDHFVPLSKGGEHKIGNIVISCPDCNLKKGSMMPYHFIGASYGWALV